MSVKAVIFDFDGTLLNSIEDIADAANKMLESYGFPIHKLDNYIGWIGNGAARLVKACLPKEILESVSSLNAYLETYNKCYSQNVHDKSHLYKGISEVLDFLTQHKIPFAINTNKPQDLTFAAHDFYLKNWNFVAVIGQNDHFEKKPAPDGALEIANKLQMTPEEILFIGDSYVDIETALAAGMQSLGVSWGYGSVDAMKEAGASTIVDDPYQIISFISSINNLKTN